MYRGVVFRCKKYRLVKTFIRNRAHYFKSKQIVGVVTAAVLCVREGWNEFAFVLALVTETGMRTLPYALYTLKDSMGVQNFAVYNAFTILTVLPLLIVYLLLERRVVESIVTGAVK